MNTRRIIVPALAALAVGALAGCGDEESSGPETAPSTPITEQAAVATTPEGSWAQKLCTAMVGKASTVQPPNVNPSSPEKTKTALIGFFEDIGDQLDDQVAAIKQVGPPPGSASKADWEKALDQMSDVNAEVAKIRRSIRAASAENAADINAVVDNLGKQMSELTEYTGPVAELKESKKLKAALEAEPACEKVS